jgi:tryptophan synthase alpha chain
LSRIAPSFERFRHEGRKGFIPFITAGDPDLATTRELILELAPVSTVIELGVPFTDPMADGPVIQRASERALQNNFGLSEILQVTADARQKTEVPIILFSYFNPLLQFGLPEFARAAKRAGLDGVLVTDLVPEEAAGFASVLRANELDMIFLVAPTSTDERLRMIAERASGFIYAVSRAGITGAREEMSAEAERLVTRVRQFSDLPVAVGFGISKPEHIADVSRYADAAVVGSAIVSQIESSRSPAEALSRVGDLVRQLLS